MIISGNTASLTFTGTQFDDFTILEQASTRTAGGNIRTIRAGQRFKAVEKIRMTGTVYASLMSLLTDNSEQYLYTPTIIPDYLSSSDFPMKVNIGQPRKIRHAGGGTKKYYVEIMIEGTARL
jgi:hypothetical protein